MQKKNRIYITGSSRLSIGGSTSYKVALYFQLTPDMNVNYYGGGQYQAKEFFNLPLDAVVIGICGKSENYNELCFTAGRGLYHELLHCTYLSDNMVNCHVRYTSDYGDLTPDPKYFIFIRPTINSEVQVIVIKASDIEKIETTPTNTGIKDWNNWANVKIVLNKGITYSVKLVDFSRVGDVIIELLEAPGFVYYTDKTKILIL